MRPNEYDELLKKIKCSDDFRKRMQEKLSSPSIEMTEYEDSVSGTEVITAKHSWSRFAAMAAAFVLVCGAVGGGAYHLANVNKTTKESSDISEIKTEETTSIFSKLKAEKELYHGDMVFKQDSEVKLHSSGLDIEPFISYMDQFNMDNEIDQEDFDETGRSITIDFYEKKCDEEFAAKLEQAANDETIHEISLYDEASYSFTLYNNGCYTMTDTAENRTTYHCFSNGEKVLNDILEMYVDDEMLEQINTVSKTEMMTALQKGFDNYNDGKAYYYPANSNKPIDCIVSDRSGFRDELWEFEWERAGIPSGDVDLYYLGFTINVDGYMQIYVDDMENNYKLKNDSDLEKLIEILDKHIIKNEDSSIYSKLKADKDNCTADISSDTLKKNDIDKNKLFEYLDNYDMSTELEMGAYVPSDNRIKIFFRKNGAEKQNHSYIGTTENYDYKLEIYDNGIFTLTEKVQGAEKATYHSFNDEGKAFSDILQMFADSE